MNRTGNIIKIAMKTNWFNYALENRIYLIERPKSYFSTVTSYDEQYLNIKMQLKNTTTIISIYLSISLKKYSHRKRPTMYKKICERIKSNLIS